MQPNFLCYKEKVTVYDKLVSKLKVQQKLSLLKRKCYTINVLPGLQCSQTYFVKNKRLHNKLLARITVRLRPKEKVTVYDKLVTKLKVQQKLTLLKRKGYLIN